MKKSLIFFSAIFIPSIIGYALCKHIAEALQKWSAAIRSSLDRYNAAARALRPPRTTLKWDDVVEYAFLSDFNLLRDTRQDIWSRQWATPAGRLALDTHFKILRAREEINRLNIEIWRVATHIRDEDLFLRAQANALRLTAPHLAHQITVYRMVRGRFNSHHICRIKEIAALTGFTGLASVGEALEAPWLCPVAAGDAEADVEENVGHEDVNTSTHKEREDLQDKQEGEEEEEQMNEDVIDILTLTMDRIG